MNKKMQDDKHNPISFLINEYDPDVICFQEIKCCIDHQTEFNTYKSKYPHLFINPAKNRKGYSGVAVMCKNKPQNVYYDYDFLTGVMKARVSDYDFLNEGRIITIENVESFLVCVYTPNSKPKLERLQQRVNEWGPLFSKLIDALQTIKPVIITGDLNVAHTSMDIHTTKGHAKSAGFTKEERDDFDNLLSKQKLIDTFRYKNPDTRAYTYFSNFGKSRENNKGWRIDYFLVSKKLQKNIKHTEILGAIKGSDHVPVLLELS
jgi:exodeoxyribonuclease-3